MKKAITAILQFFLFLIVFGAFSFFPPFHIEHVLNTTPTGTRVFIADGLLLALTLFFFIVLIEFLIKRLRIFTRLTAAAFVFATILGFIMKFGFLTRSAF